jgi:hypothetical protein
VRGIDGALDVLGLGARNLADHLPGGGRDIVEITALQRGNPFASDEIAIARVQRNLPLERLQVRRKRATFVDGGAVRLG